MNDELLKKLKDPKFYLENLCKIKGKTPGLVPFILNEAQKDIFNTIKKNNRIIILKARQLGFCLSPKTRVLTADFRWITLDEIKIGEIIVAVDEHVIGGRGSSRKMRKAIVENKCDVFEQAYRITMDNGTVLEATARHKFLFKYRGAVHTIWREVSDARVGDEIRLLTDVWENDSSYEDGWFGGMIDGEGSLCRKSRTGSLLGVSQISGKVFDRLLNYVRNNNINFRIEVDRRNPGFSSKFGSKDVNKVIIGQMGEIFKVLGKTRPTRMITRDWWEGKKMPGNGKSWAKIVSIEIIGKQRMIDLQTSSKTYVAEGFVSHNSTAVIGYLYHSTIMTPGTNTAIIGYNTPLTAELLDKVKTFWKTTPEELRPTIQYNSKSEISFPKIDSKIIVLPSTENVGRGYTLHNVLLTELSAWEKAEDKMMSLEASVPIEGKIIIESTPRGVGNLYHKMYVTKNDYVKKEYGWWWGYSESEIEIIKKRMNNPMRFAQEYGLEFLASGRSVFDQMVINKQRQNVLHVGEKNGEWTVVEDNGLRIYKDIDLASTYIFGVDTSEGIEGGDYSAVTVWNRMNGEEVASYKGLMEPDKLAKHLNIWGRKFNNALMVVEVNSHGLTTLTILKQLLYPSLYFRPSQFETMGTKYSDRLGWKTTKLTRTLMIDDLSQAIREGLLTIHSKELLDEMSTFIYDKHNNMVAGSGSHDDCLFSAAIAFQGFKVMWDKPLTQLDYTRHINNEFNF